ncbi:hypothetical protein BKA70DRAFT_1234239 [Coprinopsis sp. MPI-PUGE-AT-0042]|nr:hypothetical protein BKA70DRAFT_1234239 [Coprinopsis sp. MPI-PUGE-AT-0042]
MTIPEASQRVQTILFRVYCSLYFCLLLHLLLVNLEPGLFSIKPPTFSTIGATAAWGSILAIVTNKDLAYQLAARQGFPLAGASLRGAFNSDHTPLVLRQGIIAWAYITALCWAFDAGLHLTLVISECMLRGPFGKAVIVGTIFAVLGTLQFVLLVLIGMMSSKERQEFYAAKDEVRLLSEKEPTP